MDNNRSIDSREPPAPTIARAKDARGPVLCRLPSAPYIICNMYDVHTYGGYVGLRSRRTWLSSRFNIAPNLSSFTLWEVVATSSDPKEPTDKSRPEKKKVSGGPRHIYLLFFHYHPVTLSLCYVGDSTVTSSCGFEIYRTTTPQIAPKDTRRWILDITLSIVKQHRPPPPPTNTSPKNFNPYIRTLSVHPPPCCEISCESFRTGWVRAGVKRRRNHDIDDRTHQHPLCDNDRSPLRQRGPTPERTAETCSKTTGWSLRYVGT